MYRNALHSVATNREYVWKRIATVWQQIGNMYRNALQQCGNKWGICTEMHCNGVATNGEYVQKRIATVWQQMGNMYRNALQRCGNKWGICMETHCNGVATSRIKVWKGITSKLRQESKKLYVVSRNT